MLVLLLFEAGGPVNPPRISSFLLFCQASAASGRVDGLIGSKGGGWVVASRRAENFPVWKLIRCHAHDLLDAWMTCSTLACGRRTQVGTCDMDRLMLLCAYADNQPRRNTLCAHMHLEPFRLSMIIHYSTLPYPLPPPPAGNRSARLSRPDREPSLGLLVTGVLVFLRTNVSVAHATAGVYKSKRAVLGPPPSRASLVATASPLGHPSHRSRPEDRLWCDVPRVLIGEGGHKYVLSTASPSVIPGFTDHCRSRATRPQPALPGGILVYLPLLRTVGLCSWSPRKIRPLPVRSTCLVRRYHAHIIGLCS